LERRGEAVTREFDAPVEKVWQAWITEDYVKQWWGPTGFTAPVAQMDVRRGGTSLVSMRSPEGRDMYNTWTYEEVEPRRRLVYVSRFADRDGNAIDPVEQGRPPEIPKELRHEIVLRDAGGRTELTVTEFDWPVGPMMEMSKMGLEQTLDKMAAILTRRSDSRGSG